MALDSYLLAALTAGDSSSVVQEQLAVPIAVPQGQPVVPTPMSLRHYAPKASTQRPFGAPRLFADAVRVPIGHYCTCPLH